MMSGDRNFRPHNDPISEKAAWWALRDDAALSPEAMAERDAWLTGGPERTEAFRRARIALERLNAYAATPEMMELRRAALAARRETEPRSWAMAAATLFCVIVSGAAAFSWLNVWRLHPLAEQCNSNAAAKACKVYQTVVGERASFSLPDGSVVTLDTNSMMKVEYNSNERVVRLLRGQALFQVAKDQSIPFQAYAGDHRITDIDTLFDVRLDRDSIRIALLEGRIRVARIVPRSQSGEEPVADITMTPGEILDAKTSGPMLVHKADTARFVSWKDGVLLFENDTLAAAVSELNRYTDRPIRLADPAAEALRVSGMFKTGDSLRFAKAMPEIFPLSLSYDNDGSIVLQTRKNERKLK